jgi:hypothetical protein
MQIVFPFRRVADPSAMVERLAWRTGVDPFGVLKHRGTESAEEGERVGATDEHR